MILCAQIISCAPSVRFFVGKQLTCNALVCSLGFSLRGFKRTWAATLARRATNRFDVPRTSCAGKAVRRQAAIVRDSVHTKWIRSPRVARFYLAAPKMMCFIGLVKARLARKLVFSYEIGQNSPMKSGESLKFFFQFHFSCQIAACLPVLFDSISNSSASAEFGR